ncbi:uhpC [Symbiodinium sp. CCMP2456]|nr:uhpC [Symbiodinium sp. CCMP2456]
MMEAVVTRLQSRVELLQDHLKEQERKSRVAKGNSEAVLELQQQLAEELSKRKQAQYELIAKAKELCDVQQKMAGAGDTKDSSHEAKKELRGLSAGAVGAVSWSPSSQPKLADTDSRLSPGASRGASRGASLASPAASPVSAAPSLMLPLSGLSAKSFHQCPTSNTPQTPPTSRSSGRTSPALRLPAGEAMADRVQNQRRSPVVPPVRISNESALVRPPADEEGAHIFNPARYVRSAYDRLEPPKPIHLQHPQDAAFGVHAPQSGHVTPVSPMFHSMPWTGNLDYPRILTAARSNQEVRCNFVFGKLPERDRERSSKAFAEAAAAGTTTAGAAAGPGAFNVTPWAGITAISAGALAFSVLRRDRDWRRSLASSSSARKTAEANEGLQGDGLDLRFQKTRLVTFAGMVLGYAVYYFTRLSFTYVGLAMRKDLGLSMVQLGTISSLFPLAYMNSKFLSGVLSDLLGSPVLIFSLGLMLTGVLNMAFAAVSTVPLFTAIWVLNGLFQGCGATPCNKMLVNWFPARSRGKWWSSWNASHNIGGFLIPLLAGGLAARFGWRYGMLGPGAIAVFAGLLALLTMKDSPEKAGLPSAEDWAAPRFASASADEAPSSSAEPAVEDSSEKVWASLLQNRFLWCMAAMHFFIYFIRQGVLNWAHFYIMDEFGVPALEATARVSGFELGGLLGCIVSGQVSDWLISRYPKRGAAGLRAQVMIAYSLLAAAAVFCLWVVPPLAVFQWLAMAAFGFAIYGPQTLITMTGVETVPRKAAATAGGLLAYPAQLGSMCAGLPFALLVQEYGWGGFFPSLIILSMVSAVVIIPGWNTPSYRQAHLAA